jgi:hypothetical protein
MPWEARWPSTRSIMGTPTMGSICLGRRQRQGTEPGPLAPDEDNRLHYWWSSSWTAWSSSCPPGRGGRGGRTAHVVVVVPVTGGGRGRAGGRVVVVTGAAPRQWPGAAPESVEAGGLGSRPRTARTRP